MRRANSLPRLSRRRISRRALLVASARAGVGASAVALVGCGGEDEPSTAPPPTSVEPESSEPNSPAESQIRPPAGPPEYGGVLRLHLALSQLDFFDIHRSRFPPTQTFSALQQNKLLRYSDINAGVLEGDLAQLPEVPDETTYVFLLRPDVYWWDREPTNGRPFTADDVRENVERQLAGVDAGGAPDPLLLRQAAYAQGALEVIDSGTLVFRTEEPNASYLSAVHAAPWSYFQAPETWAIFGDLLRDEPLNPNYYSGTGPFQIDAFVPERSIVFRRNSGYFRTERPYLEAMTFVHLVDPSEQESAYAGGRVDVWSPGDPRAIDAALAERPDEVVSERPLPFGIQLAFSYRNGRSDNPLRDRRIALAVHLALDRPALAAEAYGTHAQLSGPVPWFASDWAMSQEELSSQPGYGSVASSEDRAVVAGLLAASGFTGPFRVHVPDVFEATHPGIGQELRATLQARLGMPVDVSSAAYTTILEGVRTGTVSAFLGWSEPITDPDPTARLLQTVHSQGADNLGGFSDGTVDAALEQMRVTLDLEERRRIFREQVQPTLLEAPSWMVNVAHGIQRALHSPTVQLPNFGFGWDAHLYERAWLEGATAPLDR